MLGVKLTVLLLVITVMFKFWCNALIKALPVDKIIEMHFTGKYPKYIYASGILVIIDAVMIIYSIIYLLFIR